MSTSRTREKADGELFKSTGIDDNATSTAVTIDANENVMVGKTSQNSSLSGCELLNNGTAQFTRDGNSGLRINRLTSDGELLRLSKAGTTVGSIGVESGDNLYITGGSGGTGGFYIDDTQILPATSGPTLVDNTLNLGRAATRFKDLYLSGGVVFGPASASNVSSQTLDSYEEGTFVATLRGSTSDPSTAVTTTSLYRKIGETVYIDIAFENWSTTGAGGHIQVTGLPFTSSNTGRMFINGAFYNGATWTDDKTPVSNVQGNSTKILCHAMDSNGTWDTLSHNAGSSGRYFWFSGTYPTGA